MTDTAETRLRQRVNQFFRERVKEDWHVLDRAPVIKPRYTERWRAKYMADFLPNVVRQVTKPPLDEFEADLFIIGHHFNTAADAVLMAVYHDGTLLWLDDHSANEDFSQFCQREKLLADHIDMQNPETTARLLLTLKLTFLYTPSQCKVLRTIDDVPEQSDDWLPAPNWEGHFDEPYDYAARLRQVAAQLYPPLFSSVPDGHRLSFFIWVKVFGVVYRVDCFFYDNGLFEWKAKMVRMLVGGYSLRR